MAEFVAPPTQILTRQKLGLVCFEGPKDASAPSIAPASVLNLDGDVRLTPLYSADGAVVAVVYEKQNITIYDAETGKAVVELPISDALKAEFSPKGTYLVTTSNPKKGGGNEGVEGNLRVWDARSGALLVTFSQKTVKAEVVQWTADEFFAFRAVSNEVQAYRGNDLAGGFIGKVQHKGLTQFKVCSRADDRNKVSVAVFQPESGGNPARASVYFFSAATLATTGPVISRTIMAASEVNFLWNAPGTVLLAHSHSDLDAASYYGATVSNNLAVQLIFSGFAFGEPYGWFPRFVRFILCLFGLPETE
jgi:uncharacterized protein with WD repeat